MTKEGSTKIVNFIIPVACNFVIWSGPNDHVVNNVLLGIDQRNLVNSNY